MKKEVQLELPFVTRFTYKPVEGFVCDSASCVQQHCKNECDVNVIMRRYEKSGILPHMRDSKNARYGSFDSIPTFQEAQNHIVAANHAFSLLPAKIRDRFSNDPVKYFEFVNDPSNSKELVALGLATARDIPQEPAKKPSEDVKPPLDGGKK